MIPIDIRKLYVPNKTVEVQTCKDGSVRLLQYSNVVMPDEFVDLGTLSRWGGYHYQLNVHLPEQRDLLTLATVAHTSQNNWQVTVSSLGGVSSISYKTLSQVNELLNGIFK